LISGAHRSCGLAIAPSRAFGPKLPSISPMSLSARVRTWLLILRGAVPRAPRVFLGGCSRARRHPAVGRRRWSARRRGPPPRCDRAGLDSATAISAVPAQLRSWATTAAEAEHSAAALSTSPYPIALCFTRCSHHTPTCLRETGAVTTLPGESLVSRRGRRVDHVRRARNQARRVLRRVFDFRNHEGRRRHVDLDVEQIDLVRCPSAFTGHHA
jgi:hypothetical protein